MFKFNRILFSVSTWFIAFVFAVVFMAIVGEVFFEGWQGLSPEFLFQDPRSAGRSGGIFPVLVSTGLILFICLLITVPVGLSVAVLLAECLNRNSIFFSFIRKSLDVLSGVPSIVFGLFGNAFFSNVLGLGFSLLSGGLTLSCMVLPLFIRLSEEAIRQVPHDFRMQASALSLSRRSSLLKILLPYAIPGITVAFILSISRALAETAALIFTSGYVDRMPESILDSGRFITVHIYDLAMNVPGGNQNAYQAACVLLTLILCINLLSQTIVKRWHSRRTAWS